MASKPHFGSWGFDLSGMDRSVSPGDNFFEYANGAWLKRTEIPADRTSVGPFSDLRKLCQEQVHELLERLRTQPGSGVSDRLAATLYQSYMDEHAVEDQGTAPLRHDLAKLSKLRDRKDLALLMGDHGFEKSLFTVEVNEDFKEPFRYTVTVGQGRLGLPNRDYYSKPEFAQIRETYQAYITKMLTLAGWPNAERDGPAVLAFESRIAAVSWSHEETRDYGRTYHPMSIAALDSYAPGFDWRANLKHSGFGGVQRVVLTTDTSVRSIAQLFALTPLETLKAWEAFSICDNAAPFLSNTFVQAHFSFREHALNGQPSPEERWQYAVDELNDDLGSAVGHAYVKTYFSSNTRAQAQSIADRVKDALRERIQALTWMDADTKREALRKLDRIQVQMGYPSTWRDYAGLHLRADQLYRNVKAVQQFNWAYRVHELALPWNKSDWGIWPQEPVAYTDNGQLFITAGMLQAPFFDSAADSAVNYGAIGEVIGHELTHNFDDQGRKRDADFRLRDWWTPPDEAYFAAEGKRLIKQYSAMEPLPGVHINGTVTLGENLADVGGCVLAITAYHHDTMRNQGTLDGFNGDQRFFLAHAEVWRQKVREDALRRRLASDEHSPPIARVNGVVQNDDDWYTAFHVEPGDALYLPPVDRVRIW